MRLIDLTHLEGDDLDLAKKLLDMTVEIREQANLIGELITTNKQLQSRVYDLEGEFYGLCDTAVNCGQRSTCALLNRVKAEKIERKEKQEAEKSDGQ